MVRRASEVAFDEFEHGSLDAVAGKLLIVAQYFPNVDVGDGDEFLELAAPPVSAEVAEASAEHSRHPFVVETAACLDCSGDRWASPFLCQQVKNLGRPTFVAIDEGCHGGGGIILHCLIALSSDLTRPPVDHGREKVLFRFEAPDDRLHRHAGESADLVERYLVVGLLSEQPMGRHAYPFGRRLDGQGTSPHPVWPGLVRAGGPVLSVHHLEPFSISC
jgi:hypothetical protein